MVGTPFTHIPIESSQEDEFVTYPTSCALSYVKKVMVDLRKLWGVVFFGIKGGASVLLLSWYQKI